MKRFLLFILLFQSATILIAQSNSKGSVRGCVADSTNLQHLANSTITLSGSSDSSEVAFAIADKKGMFEIKNIEKGDYLLGISYTGYKEEIINIHITADQFNIDLDTV